MPRRLCNLVSKTITKIETDAKGDYLIYLDNRPTARMLISHDSLFDGEGNYFQCGSEKPKAEPREVTGAACWASALVNGDRSGLSEHDCAVLDAWLQNELAPGETVIDVKRDDEGNGQDARFTWLFNVHTGYDARGGEVLTYIVA